MPRPRPGRFKTVLVAGSFSALLLCGQAQGQLAAFRSSKPVWQPSSQTNSPISSKGPGPKTTLTTSWEGLSTDFSLEPPDPHGAAGPNGILQVINVRAAYWDKSGNPIWGPVALDGMFRGAGNQFFSFDPRALYDEATGRFYIVLLEEDDNAQQSFLNLAVSKTSNPVSSGAGDWFFYRINNARTNNGVGYWGDYPAFGFDSQALYVTLNFFAFTNGANGDVEIIVMDKNSLLNGTINPAYVYTSGGPVGGFTLQPCTAKGTNSPANVAYFAEVPLTTQTAVRVWALADPLGARTLTSTMVTVPDNGGFINGAPQPGTPLTIDTLSPRAQGNAFWYNGSIWFCHTAGGSANKSSVFYYRINMNNYPLGTPVLLEEGSIDGGSGEWTYQPSIGANSQGDVGIVFCQSSQTRYPTIFATTRKAGALTFDAPLLIKASPNFYFGGRWGDYASVTPDPTDGSFWMTHEWARSSQILDWSTWWANVLAKTVPNLVMTTNYVVGGNGNGLIDFNECNDLYLVLTNIGSLGATNVQATLSTTNPGVIITLPRANYPDIPLQGFGTNLTPFRVSTAPGFICGTPINFNLLLKSDQATTTNLFSMPTGLAGVSLRFDNSLPADIPDANPVGTNSTVVVSNVNFALTKLTVSVHITHTFDQDLTLELIAPDGTTNILSRHNGFSGQNYGTACSPDAQRTTFDDSAATAISAGAPPFLGSFKPDQPLSVFSGKSGTNVNGTWTLHVVDDAQLDVGTLDCWSLFLTSALCVDGGGECPGADLAVGISASPEPVLVGNNLTYTISVTNNGPSSAKNVIVSQILPNNVIYVSATSSQGNCSQSGGVVTCSLGTMNALSIATITVVVIPAQAGTLSSSATVTSNQPDFDTSNNSASVLSHANPPTTDLAVGLSGSPAATTLGGSLTYTVAVTNNGPSSATGVTVTNALPSGVTILSMSVSQGSVSASNNIVVCNFGSLTNGGMASGAINVTPTVAGTLVATATAVGNQFDPISTNNTSTVSTIVGPSADVAVSVLDTPDPVVVGSNLTYRVTVTNRGPSVATAIILNNSLPASAVILSNATTQGTISQQGHTVTANIGTLAPGASALVTMVVSPTNAGTLFMSASVSAAEPDPAQGNNLAGVGTLAAAPFVSFLPVRATLTAESFSPPNGAVDIGETVTVSLRLRNAGNVRNTNLVATLLATNGVTPVPPNTPQVYGVLLPSGLPVARSFSFTAHGTNGGTVSAVLKLQDGNSTNFTLVSFDFPLPTTFLFANTNYIAILDNTSAAPYPSTITVSGLTGLVGKVTVTLSNLTHTFPQDIDALVVAPGNPDTILMSGAGAPFVTDADVTFDDSAPSPIPDGSSQIVSGSYQPAQYLSGINLPAPAPSGPYLAAMSGLNGGSPNGNWLLYVDDHTAGDTGSIAGGWRLAVTTITPVNQVADLSVAGTSSPNPVLAGSALTYLFTVTNSGPDAANFVGFNDNLAATVNLLSATVSQGTLATNGNSLLANLGVISAGSNATITIVVSPTASAAGLLTNTVNVTADENDLTPANDVASVVTTVNLPQADIGLSITSAPNPIVTGSNLVTMILVTNRGPGKALEVAVTNPLPAFSTFVSATSSVGVASFAAGALFAQLGDLAPGSSATATFIVTPSTAGPLTNVVSATTRSIDNNTADNSMTSIVSVVSPTPQIVAAAAVLLSETGPINGAIDPGETVTVGLSLRNTGSASTTNLTATLTDSGGVSPGAGSQKSYGVLVPGGTAGTNSFTFTASGTNGGVVVATLQLRDGTTDLGSVSFTFDLPLTSTFTSSGAITIPDHGNAGPYPSAINVSGLTGLVSKVTVSFNGLSHSFPRDVNALLVCPGGASVVLEAHAGAGYPITNVNLAFDDAAAARLPSATPITSGTYKPSQYGSITFPSPAPSAPYNATLAACNASNPNGTWSLYVLDDSAGDAGLIAAGWSLTITTVNTINPVANLILTLASAPPSLFVGAVFTNTITVTNLGPAQATAVQVSNNLPGGVSLVLSSLSQGSVTGATGVAVWNVNNLPVGSGAQATLVLAPAAAGDLLTTAAAHGNEADLDLANNLSSVTTTVISPLPPHLAASVTNGQVHLTITAQVGLSYVIQGSTNLASWVPLSTNVATDGTIKFIDPGSVNLKYRFYRAVRVLP